MAVKYGHNHNHQHREGKHTMTTTTDNTMPITTTDQAEPPALIFAVLNKEKTSIKNLSIAGTKIDMYHLDDVLSGLYDPSDTNPSENGVIMEFGSYALLDMTRYFVLHSIYSALATYTRNNAFSFYFEEHIKKETGMHISISYIKHGIRVHYPHRREIFHAFGRFADIETGSFNVHDSDCKPNDAVKFRIWLRAELDAIANKLKLIEPSLKALPEVLRLRSKEREETAKRKREFEDSMKEKVPYIGITAGNLYVYY